MAEIQGSGAFPAFLNVNISGPAAPSVTSASGCPNTNIVLTANQTVRWYSASSGGTLLATGTTYTHNGTNSLTVYAAAFSGSCESSRVAATATVSCGGGTLNLVRSYTVQEPGHLTISAVQAQTSATDVLVTSSYADGLGRPIQSVSKQLSPDLKDVVSVTEYDNLGRALKQYLPFKSTSGTGTYKTGANTERASFYTAQYGTIDDDYAYSLVTTDNSPLNRTLKQMAPGQPWVGSNRGVSMDYRTNTSAESVVRWTAGTGETSIPTFAGYYSANKLSVVQSTDEQGNKVLEYTDLTGKVVLKKVQDSASPGSNHTGWLCTYYVYDVYGNLKTVIPPKAVQLISNDWSISTTESDELLFHYHYDDRNRMIVKKVPGAGKVEMVYDREDRLVLSRDGKQTTEAIWVFTKYDYLGRPVMSGTYSGSTARSTLQSTINSDDSAFEVRKTSATGYTLYHNYYVKPFSSLSSLNIESVTYFDDYSFTTKTFSSAYNSAMNGGTFADEQTPHYHVNGMSTGSKTKVLGQSTWLETVNFYDGKGRLLQTRSINHLGGEDIVTNKYDFSGKLLFTYIHHKNPAADDFSELRVLKKMTYDHAGRLTKVESRNINQESVFQTLTSNTYDALGQLTQKALGNNKQYVDYTYTIRGWLSQINNPASLGSDYFGMKLKYHDATDAVDMFNGNISEIEWSSTGDSHLKRYEYSYDYSNRLTAAVYDNLSNNTYDNDFSVTGITYDPNGNIQTLTRRGRVLNTAKNIDVLNYDYSSSDIGNKLTKVTDSGVKGKIGDFIDGSSATIEYTYDASGNMLTDLNKGISSNITYNRFNLPEYVNMGGGRTITYRYDASGAKVQKIANNNGTVVTTDYVGGFIYENNNLQHFAHEEGRVRKNSQGALVYDYFIKDHLGNTRTTFTTETSPVIVYKATMESENDNQGNNIAAFEEQVFFNLRETRYTNATANQSTLADDNCTTCNEVSRTNGSLAANRIGAALLLDVMPGDELDIEVWAYNEGGISTGTSRISSTTLVTALVSAFVPGGSGTDLYTQTNSVFTGVSSYLTGGGSSGTTTPFAFLNYIVFDNNFNRVASGHQRVSSVLNAKHLLTLNNVNITQKGYVYIWVSNESNQNHNTYFDDLKVTHTKGPVLQEDHYYPGGATISALSSSAPLSKPNQFKYQGKELESDFDLNLYDFNARMYDGLLVRTLQIDPHSENYLNLSPYHWAGNNPVTNIDPDGKDWFRYTDDDGNESVVWREGSDKTIEIDGNTYNNIGSGYVKKGDDGTINIYYQNEIFATIDPNQEVGSDPARLAALHQLVDPDQDVGYNSMTPQWEMFFLAVEVSLEIGAVSAPGKGGNGRTVRPRGQARGVNRATVESLESSSRRLDNGSGARVFKNAGSADKTFKKLAMHYKPSKINTSSNGTKYFKTGDGRTISLRKSGSGEPTISIQKEGVNRQTKIRFSND